LGHHIELCASECNRLHFRDFFSSTAGNFNSINSWTKLLNFGLRTIAYTALWLAVFDPRVRSFHPQLRFVAILLSLVKFGFDFWEVFFRKEALSFTAYFLKVILGAGSVFVAAVYFTKICLAFKFGRLADAWMSYTRIKEHIWRSSRVKNWCGQILCCQAFDPRRRYNPALWARVRFILRV
jgi:hypothetical protein